MSNKPVRKVPDSLELLERLLQRTTLTTQRAGHTNVKDVGGKVYQDFFDFTTNERKEAVARAIKNTEETARRQLKQSLCDAHQRAEAEKQRALEAAREEASRTAARVAALRDQLEAERSTKLRWSFDIEKRSALEEQWNECERIKEAAVRDAIAETTTRLRREFALAKELAIAEALKMARDKFKLRLSEQLQKMKAECERLAAEEAARVAKLHSAEVARLECIIEDLRRQNRDETDARELVQDEFKALQEDYRRFLDYTDGKYHSDYLMRLRKHGMKYDHNWDRISTDSVDIFPLPTLLHKYTKLAKVKALDDPSAKENRFVPVQSR